jgi:hypothetical protein
MVAVINVLGPESGRAVLDLGGDVVGMLLAANSHNFFQIPSHLEREFKAWRCKWFQPNEGNFIALLWRLKPA